MTLLDQAILALINYRKRNGYTRTIHPTAYDEANDTEYDYDPTFLDRPVSELDKEQRKSDAHDPRTCENSVPCFDCEHPF